MSNIKYRPKIEYHLDDINTTNNIKDQYFEGNIKDNVIAPKQIVKDNSDLLKKELERLRSIIDDRLKDSIIQIDTSLLDDVTKSAAKIYNDGERLLSDGIITYQLYISCIDDMFMSPIVNQWEKSHSGIEGKVEAEVLPYILDIQNNIEAIIDILDKTLTYDDEILDYSNLKNELSTLYRADNPDIAKIKSYRKSIYNKERKIEFYKNILSVAGEYVDETSLVVKKIDKIINYKNTHNKDNLINKISGNNETQKMKLLTYQGFKKKRQDLFSKRLEFSNLYNKKIKESGFKGVIKNSKLFLDIAMPIVNDLASEEDVDEAVYYIVDGIEDISNLYNQSMLNIKNILSSLISNTDEHLEMVSKKHEARMFYRSL